MVGVLHPTTKLFRGAIPIQSAYQQCGSGLWCRIDAATARWPSDGHGGVTGINDDSITATSKYVILLGVFTRSSTASSSVETGSVMAHDGTTLLLDFGMTSAMRCPEWQPFGPFGIAVEGGISVKTSNTAFIVDLHFIPIDS